MKRLTDDQLWTLLEDYKLLPGGIYGGPSEIEVAMARELLQRRGLPLRRPKGGDDAADR